MSTYTIFIVLITLSAAFAYINHKFIKMPFVIGLFFLSTVISLIIIIGSKFWTNYPLQALKNAVNQTQISEFILNIMLGFLLFAGSLHINWNRIKQQMKLITLYALGGVVLSTIVVAFLFYYTCVLFNIQIDFIYCLLFGALISPTDPIAVLGILKKANVPQKIETTIVGESLFNDGIGVVLFIALLETLKSGNGNIEYTRFGILFLQEAVGGVVCGLIFGYVLHLLLKSIDHYQTEILLTIAFVMLGYDLCYYLHVSGPLAMVVMGLLVGNYKQSETMSNVSEDYMYKFWEIIDVILNAVLFILIAFVIVIIDFRIWYIYVGLITVLIVLLARLVVVYFPKFFLPKIANITNKEAKLIVWGGLRGGLSIALVLSLPDSDAKKIILITTYICVVFSIIVQGLTIEKMARKIKTEN